MIAVVLLLAMAGSPGAVSHARSSVKDTLAVRITAFSGTLWGTVQVWQRVGAKNQSLGICRRRTCYYRPLRQARLTLREDPRNTKSWPFKAWIVHNDGLSHVIRPTLTMTIRSHLHNGVPDFRSHVRANYYNP